MNLSSFVGRESELTSLRQLLQKKVASLVVMTGRRRIGKSRLIEEFAKGKKFFQFTGSPPDDHTTAQMQRDEFARQINQQFGIGGLKADDWGDLFTLVAKQTIHERIIILFDEISWMGSKDPTFLGKLKIVWDTLFKKNPKLILVLCGSVSSWIEKNILGSTGFLGRVSLKIFLEEFNIPHCKEFFKKTNFKGSALEQFMLLCVTGGVPWYLELINPSLCATANIKNLCFSKNGILVDEYQHIFHDLFGKRKEIYRKIVEALGDGPLEYGEIARKINYPSGGPLSEYLDELVISGFLQRYVSWDIKTKRETKKISQFRISDNYIRFYIKYIAPKLNKIKQGNFSDIALPELNQFNSIMGLQFENLVLNNRKLIYQELGLHPADIICDNPYFQHKTIKQAGCQIDYLIQTRHRTLYICEIKFSQSEITKKIITEVNDKIKKIKLPHGFACVPVLIHINGIADSVIESDYFAVVIDFSKFLQ